VQAHLELGELDDVVFVSEVRELGVQLGEKRLSSKFVMAAILKLHGVPCFKPSKMLGTKMIQRKGFRQLRFRRAVPAVRGEHAAARGEDNSVNLTVQVFPRGEHAAARGEYDSVNLTMQVFQRDLLATIRHSLTLEIPQKILFYGGSPGDRADCLTYLRSNHAAHSIKAKN